ncbi:MAG: hypothetical protein GX907_05915 [Clostridiaceae bacterium]|nr:hypothetical protein [Clostridiaceae bacterium]
MKKRVWSIVTLLLVLVVVLTACNITVKTPNGETPEGKTPEVSTKKDAGKDSGKDKEKPVKTSKKEPTKKTGAKPRLDFDNFNWDGAKNLAFDGKIDFIKQAVDKWSGAETFRLDFVTFRGRKMLELRLIAMKNKAYDLELKAIADMHSKDKRLSGELKESWEYLVEGMTDITEDINDALEIRMKIVVYNGRGTQMLMACNGDTLYNAFKDR